MCLNIRLAYFFQWKEVCWGWVGFIGLCFPSLPTYPLTSSFRSVTLLLLIYEVLNPVGLTGAKSAGKLKAPKKDRFFGKVWYLKYFPLGTFLVAQWLRLCGLNAGGLGLIPGQRTRSHITTKSLPAATRNWCRPPNKLEYFLKIKIL